MGETERKIERERETKSRWTVHFPFIPHDHNSQGYYNPWATSASGFQGRRWLNLKLGSMNGVGILHIPAPTSTLSFSDLMETLQFAM